ncbi:isopentenyl phosphate kinase [Halomicroarcula sp. GCM10025817]|uniref:isopentenyl phosphate kinase n=1 Tax=Haloarcula TaxID=2237 RepID=UPI0023E810AD|nr:isopentenyl phosphate kinase [Halomicroarcula sp. SYNS111]
MTVVLKLGGSVVTEKDRPETVDDAALADAADAVAAADRDIVLVHGGGSFGHHHAAEYGVSTTEGTRDAAGVRAIHGAMGRLNDAVVSALAERDVPAVPVHPFSAGARDAAGDLTLPTAQVRTLLAEGFVSVLHGDLVAHAGRGATVLSGDELVVELAPAVDADRVGVCSTVPGVLDEAGEVVERITAFEDVAAALGGSDATDVSGGMAAKVRALLALDAPAQVFGPDSLGAFLAGESPGTTIEGSGGAGAE